MLINKYCNGNIMSHDEILFNKDIYNKIVQSYIKKNNFEKCIENIRKCEIKDLHHLLDKMMYNDYRSMPNLIINGVKGSGKKELIKVLLHDIYDSDIKTKKILYKIEEADNLEIELDQSNYHMEIEPCGNDIDQKIIYNIMDKYIERQIIFSKNPKNKFRIIIINNADKYSIQTQTSLRVIMEKYHKTCKFILSCKNYNKIIEPLLSRCYLFTMKKPDIDTLKMYAVKILLNEKKIKLAGIVLSNLNENDTIKTTLWKIEYLINGMKIKNISFGWKNIIYATIKIIMTKPEINSNDIQTLRNYLYILYIYNIDLDSIIEEITKNIMIHLENNNIDNNVKDKFIKTILKINKRIVIGKRIILHLEYLLIELIKLKNNYNIHLFDNFVMIK